LQRDGDSVGEYGRAASHAVDGNILGGPKSGAGGGAVIGACPAGRCAEYNPLSHVQVPPEQDGVHGSRRHRAHHMSGRGSNTHLARRTHVCGRGSCKRTGPCGYRQGWPPPSPSAAPAMAQIGRSAQPPARWPAPPRRRRVSPRRPLPFSPLWGPAVTWMLDVDAAPLQRAAGGRRLACSVVSGVPRAVAAAAKSCDCHSNGLATSCAYSVAPRGTTVTPGTASSRSAWRRLPVGRPHQPFCTNTHVHRPHPLPGTHLGRIPSPSRSVSKISVTISSARASMSAVPVPTVSVSDRRGTTCVARTPLAVGALDCWEPQLACGPHPNGLVVAVATNDARGGTGDAGEHLAGSHGRSSGARGQQGEQATPRANVEHPRVWRHHRPQCLPRSRGSEEGTWVVWHERARTSA
jgi:hypothetical protein